MSDDVPLPTRQLICVCLILLGESFSLTVLFPFVGFMVADFGVASSAEVGFYAGYLASAFSFGQLFSSVFLGWFSDNKGRKPVLLFGQFSACICALWFGFASSYWSALAARLVAGLTNSNWPISKAYMGDICVPANRARAFSFISMQWGIGCMIGPMIGGLLSKPAETFPSLVPPGSLFDRNPYLLPILFGALMSFLALLSTIFFLPESLKKKEEPKRETELEELTTVIGSEEKSSGDDNEIELNGTLTMEDPAAPTIEDSDPDSDLESVKLRRKDSALGEKFMDEFRPSRGILSPSQSRTQMPILVYEKKAVARAHAWVEMLRSWNTRVVIGMYCVISLTYITVDEVTPLWALLPLINGGLGFGTAEIGLSWAVSGVYLICFQLFVFTRLDRKIGTLWMFRFGMAIGGLSLYCYPLASVVGNYAPKALMWIVLAVFWLGRTTAGTAAFTSINILVNLCSPGHLGKINGLAASVTGVFRAIGPAVGATLFAWSNINGLPFPLDNRLIFLLFGLLNFTALSLSFLLPPSFAPPN